MLVFLGSLCVRRLWKIDLCCTNSYLHCIVIVSCRKWWVMLSTRWIYTVLVLLELCMKQFSWTPLSLTYSCKFLMVRQYIWCLTNNMAIIVTRQWLSWFRNHFTLLPGNLNSVVNCSGVSLSQNHHISDFIGFLLLWNADKMEECCFSPSNGIVWLLIWSGLTSCILLDVLIKLLKSWFVLCGVVPL